MAKTTPERTLAAMFGRYIDADMAAEILGEAMGSSDLLPDEAEALEALDKWCTSDILDNAEAAEFLARLAWTQHIDRDALSAELAARLRKTARAGLRQLGKGIAEGKAEPTTKADQAKMLASLRTLELMKPGGLHSIGREWRRAVDLPKERFDRLALELARKGQIVLHHHDYPESLTDAERAAMVYDPQADTYYVGVGFVGF